MRLNDAVIGIFLILFALAEIAYAQTFPSLYGQAYGPDLFPTVIGVGLIVCGVVLVVQGLASRAGEPMAALGDWANDRRQVVTFILVLVSLLFYILTAGLLGFIPVSLIILLTLFRRFGVGWIPALLAAIATTLVIQALFARFLLVPLPWGLLQPVAW